MILSAILSESLPCGYCLVTIFCKFIEKIIFCHYFSKFSKMTLSLFGTTSVQCRKRYVFYTMFYYCYYPPYDYGGGFGWIHQFSCTPCIIYIIFTLSCIYLHFHQFNKYLLTLLIGYSTRLSEVYTHSLLFPLPLWKSATVGSFA